MNRQPAFRRLLAVTVGAVAIAAPLAACGEDEEDTATTTSAADTTETTEAASSVTIASVWARPGTTGGNSAIYMEITGGAEDDALVGATVPSDVATKVELHETVASGGESGSTDMGGDTGDSMGTETTTSMDMGSTTMAGGESPMMQMRQVEKIDIPADTTVSLEPGGLHVMLFDLQKDLVAGDSVEVTLTFSSGGEQTLTAEVQEP